MILLLYRLDSGSVLALAALGGDGVGKGLGMLSNQGFSEVGQVVVEPFLLHCFIVSVRSKAGLVFKDLVQGYIFQNLFLIIFGITSIIGGQI